MRNRLFWCLALVGCFFALTAQWAAAQSTVVDFAGVSNLALWSALIAGGVPWVAAALNRTSASALQKWAVFLVVCLGASAGTSFFTGDLRLDPENWIRSLLIVVTLAGVYYKLWQPAVKEVEGSVGR